jgi:hypothetical protein
LSDLTEEGVDEAQGEEDVLALTVVGESVCWMGWRGERCTRGAWKGGRGLEGGEAKIGSRWRRVGEYVQVF